MRKGTSTMSPCLRRRTICNFVIPATISSSNAVSVSVILRPVLHNAAMPTDSLFFSIAKCQRSKEYAGVAVSAAGVEDISWRLWDADWTLDKLDNVFKHICTNLDKSIYIGVTESPIWRWELCRDHTDTDMKAHRDHCENVFVLCVDCRDCIQVLEEHLLEHVRTVPGVSRNILSDPVYRPGP